MENILTSIRIISQVSLDKAGYWLMPRDTAVRVGLRLALIANLAGSLWHRNRRVTFKFDHELVTDVIACSIRQGARRCYGC
jgi:hypothetical protein